MSKIDLQNRSPEVLVLPDERLRVTRVADILNYTTKDIAKFLAEIEIPWGTPDVTYPDCRLILQSTPGQNNNPAKNPNDPPPQLVRVYEEIDEEDETQVGEPAVTYDEDGALNIGIDWIQFSSGTAVYETVGTTTAPAPFSDAILREEIRTNDGTLQRIRRNYVANRTLSDVSELRFGGKVITRTITARGTIPPTPAGFTLVGPGVLHPDGREIYTYQFAAAAGSGGVPGTSGEISRSYYNAQGGEVNFNPLSPTTAKGVVKCVIQYVTPVSVTTNPIPLPAGFILVGLDEKDETGYKTWEGTYYYADGLVVDESTTSESGALVVYHRVAYGAAPTTPSSTIGGTVTLFDSSVTQQDGYVRYDYRWIEGNGQSDYTVEGESDGALTYVVVEFADAPGVPSYPGTGTAYNIRLQQKTNAGYFTNIAVWKKPPADRTFLKIHNFEMPGAAYFTVGPDALILQPPTQMKLLADYEVTYDVTQISDVPFSVQAGATVSGFFTPTDTGIANPIQTGLGDYLAGASSVTGAGGTTYNGILCDEYNVVLISSIPSAFPGGTLVIDTDNDPYLTDINGVMVFRRTKVSYAF